MVSGGCDCDIPIDEHESLNIHSIFRNPIGQTLRRLNVDESPVA